MSTQKIIRIKGKKLYLDKQLYGFLNHFQKAIKLDWDLVFMMDGVEGVGKTSFAVMLAYILSKGNLTNKNIVFTPEQFIHACKTFPVESFILWDEAILGYFSEDFGMSPALSKTITTIRKRRLKIAVLAPYFFMLRKYIAVARTKFLIHLKTPNFMDRGFFDVYPYADKNRLYLKNKDKMEYDKKLVSFSGKIKFDKNVIDSLIDWKQYEKDKDKAIASIEGQKDKTQEYLQQRNRLIYETIYNNKQMGILVKDSVKSLSNTLELTPKTVFYIYTSIKQEEEGK